MSAIAGIIRFDGGPVDPASIAEMTRVLAHRGPDSRSQWVEGSVGLGHCMLHTTSESLEEVQPVLNSDGNLTMVMDGRVDNWLELRAELLERGARLRNRSDAELVLTAYQVWGGDCLAKIDGDFAFVIWDSRHHRAFCARDRLGNKPLNYWWDGKTFIFASELHAILTVPSVPQVPNEGMIAQLIADEVYSREETLWSGITRLQAAKALSVCHSGLVATTYWDPLAQPDLGYRKDREYIEHYRDLFFDIVRRMSRSHRPLGCHVSGGLDSTAVFCVGLHLKANSQLLAPDIKGYTLVYPGLSGISTHGTD